MYGSERGQSDAATMIGFVVGGLLFFITLTVFLVIDAAIEWLASLAGFVGGLPGIVMVLAILISLLVAVIGFVATMAFIGSL